MAQHTTAREKRKARIRKKLSGTSDRPRLTVYRSLKHIYAQVVDDTTGQTIAAADKTDAAKRVGTAIAKAAMDKGITKVVFDRNGFDYHGRIAAVAQAAREAGLEF